MIDGDSVPADRSARVSRLTVAPDVTIAGIDVGENTLFIAIVAPDDPDVRFHEIDVAGVVNSTEHPIASLTEAIVAAAPVLRRPGAIALVDSPRWPRDLDWSGASPSPRIVPDRRAGRVIDASLLAIVRSIRAKSGSRQTLGLWMFPTPSMAYFAGCADAPGCPPHLRRLAREMFSIHLAVARGGPATAGGQIFTRFMITGFAAYRALEAAGVIGFESYPDLIFRLWTNKDTLPAKRRGKSLALHARTMIDGLIADELHLRLGAPLLGLDHADAAVLALSAAASARDDAIVVIDAPGEGSFALPMRPADAAVVAYTAAMKM
jgi:hypothetical protein